MEVSVWERFRVRLLSSPSPIVNRMSGASLATVLLAAAAVSAPAHAAHGQHGLAAPVLNQGDTWTYTDTNEARGGSRTMHHVLTLVRADSQTIMINIRTVGAASAGREQLVGPEWSRVRSVNGRQTVVNRPLAYPLALGKTWSVDYTELTPADRTHTRETWQSTYKVAAWEEVTVPAGTFRVLRIEADGTWSAELPANTFSAQAQAPNGANVGVTSRQGARTVSGRLLKTFWYAPEVHRWVKSEEDLFDTNGARTSHVTSDLEAYALADPRGAETEATPDAEPDDNAPPRPRHAAKPHRPAVAARAGHQKAPTEPDDAAVPAAPRPAKPASAPPPLLQELRWTVPQG